MGLIMKCSANCVTACDRSQDGCGFCPDHCPYDDCPIHPKKEDEKTGVLMSDSKHLLIQEIIEEGL